MAKPAKQEKTGKDEIKRDEKGRWLPGVSGNPKGRPKGISITSLIKEKLQEAPKGQKRTYLELLIKRILHIAIVEGNEKMIRNIWNYVDGYPMQRHEIEGKIEAEITKLSDEEIKKQLEEIRRTRAIIRKRIVKTGDEKGGPRRSVVSGNGDSGLSTVREDSPRAGTIHKENQGSGDNPPSQKTS